MRARLIPLSLIASIVGFFISPAAFAISFSWTANNLGIVVNADSLELGVGGITVTAQAFTAEINTAGDDAAIVGPWPTKSAVNAPGLGVDVRGLGSEQLGLIADPTILPDANGSDIFSGGLSPGFSSGYGNDTVVNPAVPAFHFVVFMFSQPVDLLGVTVDDVTNQDRDIWMGTSMTAPDFTGGFLSSIADFDIFSSPDNPASDGLYTHSLPSVATGIRYFLVGAPPQGADLGPINGTGAFSGSNFFIDSFDGTPSGTSGLFTLDIDANGTADALADGLLIIRHLFGFSGDSLTAGAIGPGATRSNAADITSYLNANSITLDIDANGIADTLTDGLLIIRYLFGFSGDSLTAGAIGPSATRSNATDIANYLNSLMP